MINNLTVFSLDENNYVVLFELLIDLAVKSCDVDFKVLV